jgi:hypothetical protein
MDKPTWSLVLDAARELGADGAEFSRAALVDAVFRRDPGRQANSIGPVIQGMTSNATGGPPSPCGTPLLRVSHGWYRLARTPSASPTQRGPVLAERPSSASPTREAPTSATVDLVLVGCVKTKADGPQPARTLYRSPLFERSTAPAPTRPGSSQTTAPGLVDGHVERRESRRTSTSLDTT